ncbi:MAG: OmpH family outer membrane protein [Bacteroidia bacterium]
MKKIASITLLIAAVICSMSVSAQKIGHVSLDSLLKGMPESDSAKKAYGIYAQQLETTLETFQKEFQQKYQEYQQNEASYTGLVKQTKEQELTEMNQRIQAFQQQAQTSLQHFGDSIQKPVIAKAKNAVSAVAKENGYKYVLDTSQGFVLYFEDSDDLYALVAKKLGLKPKAATVPSTPKGK